MSFMIMNCLVSTLGSSDLEHALYLLSDNESRNHGVAVLCIVGESA